MTEQLPHEFVAMIYNRDEADCIEYIRQHLGIIDLNMKSMFGEFSGTPLIWASCQNMSNVARELISRGADIHCKSNSKWSALMHAASRGNMEIMRMLIAAGIDINYKIPHIQSFNWRTALNMTLNHYWCDDMSVELICAGADIIYHEGYNDYATYIFSYNRIGKRERDIYRKEIVKIIDDSDNIMAICFKTTYDALASLIEISSRGKIFL